MCFNEYSVKIMVNYVSTIMSPREFFAETPSTHATSHISHTWLTTFAAETFRSSPHPSRVRVTRG